MSNRDKEIVKYKNWIDSVAEKTKYDKKEIQSFIKKYQIPQSPGTGTPKRIQIKKITFSGTKRGRYENDFLFEFDKLSSGLWGLFSDGNGKGKSTALEVIKWLLKGRPSDGLQSGVKSWIKKAELIINSDEFYYSINVNQDEDYLSGEIRKSIDGIEYKPFKEFSSEEDMSITISEFMMSQLDLEKVISSRQGSHELDSGSEVTHGWPALASAMFIGTSYSAIFGDVAISGLPNRILNMYMGLPWIPTYSALKALEGQLKNVTIVEEKHKDRAEEDRLKRLKEIQSHLKEKEKLLAEKPIPSVKVEEYHQLIGEYNSAFELEKNAQRRVLDCQSQLQQIKLEADADQIKLRNFKEDRAANKIFKQINPTCCPHCEQKVTAEQIQKEIHEHRCSVCDKEMFDGEDAEELFQQIKSSSKLTSDALKKAQKELKIREKAFEEAGKLLSEKETSVRKYKNQLDAEKLQLEQIDSIEKEIMKLKILETEYQNLKISQEKGIGDSVQNDEQQAQIPVIDEALILKEALKETQSRFKGLQEDLLIDVNKKMLEYCSKVGLKQYNNLTLNGQPSLKIVKDGGETSFSKVSKGEQLRLKVIATIALISVAEERKLGRHPGFLVIDSPAAQEVNREDLNNLIGGLENLCKELPHLQIIVASVANETLLEHIPMAQRKYAEGDKFLW